MMALLRRVFGSRKRCALCGYAGGLRQVKPPHVAPRAEIFVCKKCSDRREMLAKY
jgi:hypothetical protein